MLDLFYMGGPLFMSLVTAALALVITAAALALRTTDAARAAQYRRAVAQSALLAAVLGILGQAIGLYDAMTVIEAMGGEVSPALLAGGIKVSFVAPLYGLGVCALGLLLAALLSLRVSR
jgi:hypothetical protein